MSPDSGGSEKKKCHERDKGMCVNPGVATGTCDNVTDSATKLSTNQFLHMIHTYWPCNGEQHLHDFSHLATRFSKLSEFDRNRRQCMRSAGDKWMF